eukprot:scaffold5636_cov135-Skeletonema_menzelii.AAC.2
MAAAAAKEEHQVEIILLRNWIEGDADAAEDHLSSAGDQSRSYKKKRTSRESMIRKVTVAYGIVELLVRCPTNNVLLDDDAKIGIDNFAVCVSKKTDRLSSQQQQSLSSWDDIKGVRMVSSGLSLSIEEPSYLSCLFEKGGEEEDQMGRYLEVELDAANALVGITKTFCRGNTEGKEISKFRCHYLLAKILYQLFTNNDDRFPDGNHHQGDDDEPAHKKAKKAQLLEKEGGFPYYECVSDLSSITAVSGMQQLEVPASICRMVQNLFESASESGGDAYKTLEEVGKDLHLLLLDPDRFLFDREARSTYKMELLYRKEKLYGRDKEETLITDAFCRVSRGRNEAFFIGGFSGSGKSMLVDTLRLKDDFGDDIGLLARMLPNICLLSPECSRLSVGVDDGNTCTSDKMNPRSVSFTLLRFVRLVSSPKHPIM